MLLPSPLFTHAGLGGVDSRIFMFGARSVTDYIKKKKKLIATVVEKEHLAQSCCLSEPNHHLKIVIVEILRKVD